MRKSWYQVQPRRMPSWIVVVPWLPKTSVSPTTFPFPDLHQAIHGKTVSPDTASAIVVEPSLAVTLFNSSMGLVSFQGMRARGW